MSTAVATVSWREGLSKGDRELMDDLTQRIKGHLGKSVEALYLAGCELQKSRVILKEEHRWVEWLDKEFKPGFRVAAWRMMTLAEKLEKPYKKGLLLQFATSATYELCKPSAPEGALDRAVEEAEEGKTITHTRAKELVKEQREEEMQAAEEALESLPPDAQKRLRKAAREKALRDARKGKLEAIERHLKAARGLMDGEPDIGDEVLEKLDEVLEACQEALA